LGKGGGEGLTVGKPISSGGGLKSFKEGFNLCGSLRHSENNLRYSNPGVIHFRNVGNLLG